MSTALQLLQNLNLMQARSKAGHLKLQSFASKHHRGLFLPLQKLKLNIGLVIVWMEVHLGVFGGRKDVIKLLFQSLAI